MGKIDFYYQSKKVNEDIANWHDLEIEVQFDDEVGQGSIKSGSLEFTGALADKINAWNDGGMNGGPGIFEAPEFRIEACGNSRVFDGGVNTADCETSYECGKVVASLRGNKIDFINDRANAFTFAFLASLPPGAPGRITQSDYVSVPYVINSIPDYVNVMVAGLSLYTMVKELETVGEKTKSVIEELIGDTAMAGSSAVVVPPVGAAMVIGRVLADIIRIILYIAYLLFIIKIIVSLIRMIFDNLIQPIKYKKGMRIQRLWQLAADYMGMQFSSTLYNNFKHIDDVIIPRKIAFDLSAPAHAPSQAIQTLFGVQTINRKEYDDAKNPTSVGYFEGTFTDLILAEEARLNAELRVIGNTIHFETKDYLAKFSSYTLPNIKNKNADPHGTNACELAANYLLTYALDDQDTNTYDQYTGTSCQMTLSPIAVINKKNILLKNLTDVRLIYALAKIKTTLSAVEQVVSFVWEIADDIYTAVSGFFNTIIKVINTIFKVIAWIIPGKQNPPQIPLLPPFPPNPIAARIGMMLLSSDFTGVPKVLVIRNLPYLGNNVPPNAFYPHSNNVTLTAARTLIDELHFTNFAIRKIDTYGAAKNDHNQELSFKDKEVPFCCADYLKLLDNNYGKTYDSKQAKMKSIIWKPHTNTARVTYRVKQQYTKNLNQAYVIDGRN